VKIPPLYNQPEPTISFEFFPPKTDEAEETLIRDTIPALLRLRPAFGSLTCGAGGGARDRTLRVVDRIRRETGMETMAHLTCVGSTREMLAGLLDQAERLGIDNILALRGDPPRDQPEFRPVPGGFSYAVELVGFIKEGGRFAIGVAGYPEGHIECPDKVLDWDRTVAKVEAGAEFILTQLFYDAEDFLAFEDYLRNKRGLRVPIVPGVLPFLSAEQIRRMSKLCGARLPEPLTHRLEKNAGDDEAVRQLGVEICTDICRRLLDHGVPGIHFYCLNRAQCCTEVMRNLGLPRSGAWRPALPATSTPRSRFIPRGFSGGRMQSAG
jgi:methylenetetrahydrofolate reductase (NADPH)